MLYTGANICINVCILTKDIYINTKECLYNYIYQKHSYKRLLRGMFIYDFAQRYKYRYFCS